jgi:hypothetical protein
MQIRCAATKRIFRFGTAVSPKVQKLLRKAVASTHKVTSGRLAASVEICFAQTSFQSLDPKPNRVLASALPV